ncbi:MAG TPA: anti-sigma F factor antagonist [Epulopiscium sp.]|nr:anti-sigma F factor antagonist [Candidatus Epulonipiscium sp.]
MQIFFTTKDRNLIVTIEGEVDHHTSVEIRERVDREYQRRRTRNIIFDFSNIRFMDSSGIGVLMGRYRNVMILGGSVALYGVGDQVDRVLSISGIYKIMKNYDSIDEAIVNLA